jgi:ABC-type glutathione transport system ATPase component
MTFQQTHKPTLPVEGCWHGERNSRAKLVEVRLHVKIVVGAKRAKRILTRVEQAEVAAKCRLPEELRMHHDFPEEHFIDIRNLVKLYKSPAGEFAALKGLDVQIEKGEFVAVIGKSGSGKSTFINMLSGTDRPSSGEVDRRTAVHSVNENRWRMAGPKSASFQFSSCCLPDAA